MVKSTKITMLLSCLLIWISIIGCSNKRYNIIEVTYLAKDAGEHNLNILVYHELDGRYEGAIRDYVKNQGSQYDSCDTFHTNELPHLLSITFPSVQILSIRKSEFNCQK